MNNKLGPASHLRVQRHDRHTHGLDRWIETSEVQPMRAARVNRYRRPAYPTRMEVQSNPRLLSRHVPPAWRAVPELAGAMALLVATSTTSCKPASKTPVVAPLFEHGEGRGVTGCVVVSPPVFLSEEDALQMIREELARYGVVLSLKEWKVPGMKFNGAPTSADAVDLQKKVAIEFISAKDHSTLQRAQEDERFLAFLRPVTRSTVRSYDFPEMARYFSKRVRQEAEEKIYIGTFYDPATKESPESRKILAQSKSDEEYIRLWEKSRLETHAESKRLLRLQVQDFVKWLQAQGAI